MRWLISCAILLMLASLSFGDPCETGAQRELKVFSNNVGIFPAHVVARYPANLKEKKKNIIQNEQDRAARLAQVLLDFEGDPDVVLLQEIWSIPRDALIQDLAKKYPYFKHPAAETAGPLGMQPSGLIVFSKYPLGDFAFKPFTKAIGLEKVANKGIVGVRLTKDGRTVALFNTHLQAGNRRDPTVKSDQLRECNQFIREFTNKHEDKAVVLAGDFNTDSTDPAAYGEIFATLAGARDSYQQGCSPLEQTGRNNKYPKKRIDYLLTFDGVEAVSTIVDPAGDRISDHLAVFGKVPLD